MLKVRLSWSDDISREWLTQSLISESKLQRNNKRIFKMLEILCGTPTCFTIRPSESRWAVTPIAIDSIHARWTISTCVVNTIVNVWDWSNNTETAENLSLDTFRMMPYPLWFTYPFYNMFPKIPPYNCTSSYWCHPHKMHRLHKYGPRSRRCLNKNHIGMVRTLKLIRARRLSL